MAQEEALNLKFHLNLTRKNNEQKANFRQGVSKTI